MFDFDKHLSALAEQTVLCIGDLMLDEFVYGEVSRISPEAPTPVIAVKRTETMIGGAGNVARNLVALGTRCIFVGVVGDDDAGRALTAALATHPLIEFHLVVDAARQTTRKVRFVSEHHSTHLLRADWEMAAPIDAASEDALIGHVNKALPRVGAVVLSDYAKGALTPRVIRAVIEAANKAGKPVVVDPKGRDYGIYRGATLITPNRQELADATNSPAATDDQVAAAAAEIARELGAKAVLVTRSEAGMTLVAGEAAVHVPAYPVRVRDVSGAGDTVVAVASAMLAMQADFESAMRAANAAAAVVVGKRGTATALRRRAALAHPAGLDAGARGKDRVRLGAARRTSRRMAPAGPAHRLHQWLLRSAASRPRQAHGRRARGLRPPGGGFERRRLGDAAQRRGPSGAGRAGARRSFWRRWKRSIWWWCSTRTRRKN